MSLDPIAFLRDPLSIVELPADRPRYVHAPWAGVRDRRERPICYDLCCGLGGWSRSNSRKAASALIAKIPAALARHIARCYKPHDD